MSALSKFNYSQQSANQLGLRLKNNDFKKWQLRVLVSLTDVQSINLHFFISIIEESIF